MTSPNRQVCGQQGSGSGVVVAAFDVDGTLTTRDCVRPFLEQLGGRLGLLRAVAGSPLRTAAAVLRRDRDLLKDVVVGGVFGNRLVDDVAGEGRRFAAVIEATMLRPDTVARMRWHQSMGHRTVMVSASLRSYLAPLGASLGIEQVLCTDVASRHGRFQSSLDGPNCRAAEKAVRLRAWLASEGIGSATIWAYGDSRGDDELLAMAHHPVRVRGTTVTAVPDEMQR